MSKSPAKPNPLLKQSKESLINIIESLEKRIAQLEYQASLRNQQQG